MNSKINLGNISPITATNELEAESLINHIGETVTIHGMIHRIRAMKGFAFVLLRTKRALVQCVHTYGQTQFPITLLKPNMSVTFCGVVAHEPRSKTGCEVHLQSVTILSEGDAPPVAFNGNELSATLETLLDYRPLTLRNIKERAIFKVQECLARAFRTFLTKENFTEIRSPKLVFSGAEGGANIFELPYFGKTAYLTQSPQFYKQMLVGVYERVFEIAPVFRAEKHDTSRHLNEYTSVDFEMGFINSFEDIMAMECAMLKYAFEALQAECAPEIELLGAKIPAIAAIPAIPFIHAKELIAATYNRPITDENDFEPEEERLLCEIIEKQTGSELVFVTHYRSAKRPFYAMDTPGNPQITESFDLLLRGVEITTGGQRIHSHASQVEKMLARSMDASAFSSFLMAHKCGLPPHGGLGLGLERLTAQLLGFANVRRATLFPRDTHRLEP